MLRMRSAFSLRHVIALTLVFGVGITSVGEAEAAKRRKTRSWDASKFAAIVVDANTDKVLYSQNGDKARYPASLTKMMTLYVLFDDMAAGRIKKSTKMSVSARAAGQVPSKLGLKPGQTITVDQAIRALVTKSANDVAVVVAEHVSGSESSFAERMTRTARGLGMSSTTFRNASGLPDSGQRTTARDLSVLARALIRNHPDYYSYFSTRSYTHSGRSYRNHNRLLGRVDGVDGIKTGYINASGFNLTTSAKRGRRHLVAVVMGGPTGATRDAKMRSLLETYFPKASNKKSSQQVAGVAPKPELIARVPVPSLRPVGATQRQATTLATEDTAAKQKPAVLGSSDAQAETQALTVTHALPAKIDGRMPMASDLKPTTLDAQHRERAGDTPSANPSAPKGLTVLVRTSAKGKRTVLASLAKPAAPTARIAATEAPAAPQPAAGSKMNDTVANLIAEQLQDLWLIQIGAFDEEAAARKKLDEALAKEKMLKSRLAYTEPVTKNELTLYRARFMGFDRGAAEQACAALKKAKFKCLAMRQ